MIKIWAISHVFKYDNIKKKFVYVKYQKRCVLKIGLPQILCIIFYPFFFNTKLGYILNLELKNSIKFMKHKINLSDV